MAWVWSAQADLTATLVSGGSPPTITQWHIDALTIPSSLISSPLTGAMLFVAAWMDFGTVSNAMDPDFTFVDSGGNEVTARPTYSGRSGAPFRSSIKSGYGSANEVLFDRNCGPTGFNGGGTVRIRGAFQDASNESVTGLIAAAIFDSTNSLETLAFNHTAQGGIQSNDHGNVFVFSPVTVFDGAMVGMAGDAGTTASLPTCTNASDWTNLQRRTRGQQYVMLGAYTGPLTGGPYWQLDFTNTTGTLGFVFDWESVIGPSAAPAQRRRAWAGVIGD